MSYMALYREWRPQLFSDIVGQEHISRTIQNAIRTGRIAHAYLLCGPRGTGKTTTAKVLAKALNCLEGPGPEPCNCCENCKKVTEGTSMDVMEIDAASNRGIDEMRDLREKVKFAPTEGRYRIYIIDEVHMLTTEAFNALLKTLEEPPAHVMFILATTEPHKIPLTILSRCQRFDFRRIGLNDIIGRLRKVVEELGVTADDESLRLIARTSEGGMRDALSVLDQCISFGGKEITVENINTVLGAVNTDVLFRICQTFTDNNVTEGLKLVDYLVNQGKDVRQFTKDLTEHLRNLLMTDVCSEAGEIVPVTTEVLQKMKEQASALGRKKIISLIDLFTSAEQEMRWTSQPRLILELALIKAGDAAYNEDYQQLLDRVNKLESLIKQGTGAAVQSGQTGHAERKAVKEAASGDVVRKKPVRPAPGKSGADPQAAAPPNIGETSGSVDTETVIQCWQEILERIKKVRMSARAFLIEGEPVGIDQGSLILRFPVEYSFHKERVEQPENRTAIEQVIREVTGADLKIKCKFPDDLAKKESAAAKPQGNQDPLVDQAQIMFGGEVIEIVD